MAKRVRKAAMVTSRGSGEDAEEIEARRKAIAAEAKAREVERRAAWEEHERARKEAEERRRASEPDQAFVEAARRAKERAEQERIDLHRKSYDAESRRRNSDEKTENRFRDKHPDVLRRHMAAWANLQEISQGADVGATREALQVMARCWKEKDDLLLALSRKKGKDDVLEARTESLKGKLAAMEESRRKATPKPARKRRAPRKSESKSKGKGKGKRE